MEQILREIECGLIGQRRYPVIDTPLEAYSQRSTTKENTMIRFFDTLL